MVTYLSALKFSNQPLKRGSKFTPLKMKFFQLVQKQAARLCKNPVKQTHLWYQSYIATFTRLIMCNRF